MTSRVKSFFQGLQTYESTTLIWTLLFFTYVGNGLSYGALRPAHILGLFLLPFLLARLAKTAFRRDQFFFPYHFWVLFLFWYGLSLLWVVELPLGVKYCFYIANGVFTISVFALFVNQESKLRTAISALGWAAVLNFAVGCVEAVTGVRWLIGRLSRLNQYFGIDPMYNFYIRDLDYRKIHDPAGYDYLIHQPTGLNWGPNQFGYAICLATPFFLFGVRNTALWSLFMVVCLWMNMMVASRAVSLGLIILFLAALAMQWKVWSAFRRGLVILALISIPTLPIATSLFGDLNPERFAKFTTTFRSIMAYMDMSSYHEMAIESDDPVKINELALNSAHIDGSVSKRQLMLMRAWDAFTPSLGLGVGAGNSAQHSGMLFGKSQIHNFWAEILFEAGVIFAGLFCFWYLLVLWMLYRITLKKDFPVYPWLPRACLVAMLVMAPAALAVGTGAYQMSTWLVFGLSVSVILVDQKKFKALT